MFFKVSNEEKKSHITKTHDLIRKKSYEKILVLNHWVRLEVKLLWFVMI